jgi:hypothetical protein
MPSQCQQPCAYAFGHIRIRPESPPIPILAAALTPIRRANEVSPYEEDREYSRGAGMAGKGIKKNSTEVTNPNFLYTVHDYMGAP